MRTNLATKKQQGAAVLAITMLLLFGATIVVFYLNRGIIFEQKSSANQLRSTSAQEIAEAGIEWATGKMNTPYDIQASDCSLLSTTQVSFRKKYVQTGATTAITAATNVFPGCKISGTTLQCNCPNVPAASAEAVANLGSNVLPGFTLAFADVPGDAEAVLVTSTGCTSQAGTCKQTTPLSAATTGASDATATISVILKMRPLIRAAPASPLTCGTTCALTGSFSVQNFDPATNGITVNSGSASTGTSAVGTIPGLPPSNSVVSGDASLSAIASNDLTCTNNSMFKTYFGSTMAEFSASPATKSIACSSASDCGSKLNTAMNEGWRSYYFPDGLALNNSAPFSQLGSTADPVTIVSPGAIEINGGMDVYGMLFSNSANGGDLGTGSSNIHGAMVTCAGFTSNGNGNVLYDPSALQNLQRTTSIMVRVPGSWRDF